ncbi:MAG: sigma-70 family RNA polymerase sigma factor [Elusimicrobiota bacterium]|jgi:RNA polymerase sigma-70 factor (ECF subfamily)
MLEENRPFAWNFAYGLAKNPVDAEELVQEAAYRILQNKECYDPVQSFKSWYLTIVKNLYLDGCKLMSRRATASLDSTAGDGKHSLMDVLRDPAPGPLEQLLRQERIEAVRALLEDLSVQYREVLTLCDIEGLGYEEAARKLRLPCGTVRSRLSRARALLRRDLVPA